MGRLQQLAWQRRDLDPKKFNAVLLDEIEQFKTTVAYVDDIALFTCLLH
jgi:hypothetical protein